MDCTPRGSLTPRLGHADLKGWYQNDLLPRRKLRVLLYNGDADPAVQASGVEAWADALGLATVEEW